MTKSRDFTAPDKFSDVALVVEGRKLYANKAFLSKISPIFNNMFKKDFAESKHSEVQLHGPLNNPLKYDQFLTFMKVIHPPGGKFKVDIIWDLLALAHYFDVGFVFNRVDDLLGAKHSEYEIVPLMTKLLLASKYSDKLVKLEKLVLGEIKKPSVARVLMGSFNYYALNADMKFALQHTCFISRL